MISNPNHAGWVKRGEEEERFGALGFDFRGACNQREGEKQNHPTEQLVLSCEKWISFLLQLFLQVIQLQI